MIFRKNKESQQKKEESNSISGVNYETEHSLDSRLDGLRFRILNKSEFESQKETEPHSIDQISFVRVFENGEFSHFELYKGDILILPNATPPGPVNKFGKVVRINSAFDGVFRYVSTNRAPITLPTGESISGTALGFSSDSGNGTFLYTDSAGKILLGRTVTSAAYMNPLNGGFSSSKLSIVIAHGNNKQTLTYEIIPSNYGPGSNAGTYAYTQPANRVMIKVNNTYYLGNNYWAGSSYGGGTAVTGAFKNSDEKWQRNESSSCCLVMVMPYIHGYNIPTGHNQFEVRLYLYSSSYGWQLLRESSLIYSRLGLTRSLDDGSDLGDPTYVECFVPGFTNYEDFIDIAKIICTPTSDSHGNAVII
jgi:hypothetical protein